jgi:predicted  nucleic acid-binding Zn-ribbon protein
MTRASALMRLQQVDSQIDAHRGHLVEIESALRQDRGVAEAHASLGATQASLAATRRSMRALEAEVQAIAAKGAEVEARLYDGKVTNPKELRDMQEEVASLMRRRSTLEDQLLEAMVQVEADEGGESAARQRLAEVEESLRSTHEELIGDRTRLQVVLDRLAIDREAAEAAVSHDDRQTYQSLRLRKRGVAVARLDEGVCSACGVAPSSSRAQAARHGDELIFCGNCERILYAV